MELESTESPESMRLSVGARHLLVYMQSQEHNFIPEAQARQRRDAMTELLDKKLAIYHKLIDRDGLRLTSAGMNTYE